MRLTGQAVPTALLFAIAFAPVALAEENTGRIFSIEMPSPTAETAETDAADFPSGAFADAQSLALPMPSEDDDNQ
jgi:hypothetical protein